MNSSASTFQHGSGPARILAQSATQLSVDANTCRISSEPEACSEMSRVALILEDEILIRLDLCEQLRTHGFDVHEADNTDDAVALMNAHRPSVVFTDINLGDHGDGLNFAEWVIEKFPHAAVVICSGNSPGEVRPEVMVMSKPFSSEDVLEVLELVEDRRLSR
jgi:DNA-binding NtrC family response regulator